MNVLITSASRKVSLVRAFQSALARRGGGSVVAVDTSPFAPALYLADRHFLVPPSTDPQFIDHIVGLCQRESVGLIVPTRDEELPIFAAARSRLEQQGRRVLVPSAETVRICQDKLAFVEFCRTHQFETPRTCQPHQWSHAEFPLFVKPRLGKGAQGARRVDHEGDLREAASDPERWLIQEFVDCPEYTVDLLADFEGRVISAVPRLRQLVVAGESYVSRTVNEPVLITESARLATELRLVGHNTIQCFWDGKQVKFIEVNPRFGGAAALGIAAGADTPALLLRLLEGEAIPARLGEFQSDLIMMRFTDDLFLSASQLASVTKNHAAAATKSSENRAGSSLQAVLFDLDNTLYAEEQFVASGFRAVAQCLAKHQNLDPDTLFANMMLILHRQGRGRVFSNLLHNLGLDSEAWLKTLLLVYRSHTPALSLFPETENAIATLKHRGLRVGLVTDGPAFTQRRKIASLDLERQMDVIVCTGELGDNCAKPSTIPFEVALTMLSVPPNAAAYIGDDISKDFAGPNRLGMKTVQVCSSGLVGVRPAAAPHDPIFQPQMKAVSLTEALKTLGLL
ncbi:MAG TPA: ATP-grasp domain-containing protein [Candidatus Sulfotelmatobacter sp.]|nr:ATP-grasp domain-containing protein [Candidatus Sulfotelmatobacter sp.]